MKRKAIDEAYPASGSTQSSGQPSRLCQACLSVLTRDDLELCKNYHHHKNPKSLVEAAHAMCYACSPLFWSLPPDAQRSLEQLAEGRMPDGLAFPKRYTNSHEESGPDDSNSPNHVYSARDEWAYYDNDTSWGSVTWICVKPSTPESLKIDVGLRRFEAFSSLLHTNVYYNTIREMWERIKHCSNLIVGLETPLVIDCRGIWVLPSVLRYKSWLMNYSV